MKRNVLLIILVLVVIGYLIGRGKRQQAPERLPEPISIEQISTLSSQAQTITKPHLEPLPPSGPFKPKAKEIQTALRNANFYKGLIDGKVGPMTKRAIKEFQKANGLEADGKVGPKTWDKLSTYLNP